MAAKVNISALRETIARSGSIQRSMIPLVKAKFEEEKEQLMEDIAEDSISQEIEGGPTADNSSGLLDGYGNLYSFLGFPYGRKPIEELLQFLHNTIKLDITRVTKQYVGGSRIRFRFSAFIPTREEVYEGNKVDWSAGSSDSRSWIRAIEKGINGSYGSFMYYIYSKYGLEKSRSGTGVQAKQANGSFAQIHANDGRNQHTKRYVSRHMVNFINRIGSSGRGAFEI